jgi:uncharacterized membrane protein required for colicin V production
MNWKIILDIAVVAFILVTVITCTVKGFIKTFLKSMKSIIVILLTALLAPSLVGVCQENMVAPFMEGKISTAIVEKIGDVGESFDASMIEEQLPPIVKNILQMADFDDAIFNTDATGMAAIVDISNGIEEVIMRVTSYAIAYLAVFIVISILLAISSKLLEKLGELPMIKTANKILGFVWGAISAYVEMSFIVAILPLFTGVDFIMQTAVAKWIYENGLFSFFGI